VIGALLRARRVGRQLNALASALRGPLARNHGTIAAKLCGGSRSPLEDYAEDILALVEEQSDRALDENVVAMHKCRVPGSRTTLVRFLKRHAIT